MPQYFFDPAAAAAFASGKSTKADIVRGDALFLGLNCFEAGQSQPVHSHGGADKFYLVLSGNARMIVGDQTRDAGAGTLVWAPADVPHGVET
ncbi:MAG: cupin domain-containing protein, partial [Chloroflexota bacterium]|nr:cupin domain-containing protein [Chloroflexota bacterium]